MVRQKNNGLHFPREFYAANILEVFERIAWYGFFTVSSIYMSTSPSAGGLGFSEQQRGILQGIIPFFVYILPVVTGALGDRIGYRRMFLIAFAILTPGYFMLGQVNAFWPFFLVYALVALGAAIFKPLVVGTVARSSDVSNRGRAFGIFYMMVNVGGFLGPMIAGYVRTMSWDYVFLLSSFSIGLNFLIVLFFMDKDEPQESDAGQISTALADAGHVIGNGRFILLIVPIILGLMVAGGGWISWLTYGALVAGWCLIQFLWNFLAKDNEAAWYARRLKVGNAPFLVYLLVMAVFWAVYNQVFLTLPLYIRDFVDTSDLVAFVGSWSNSIASFLAPVNIQGLDTQIATLAGASAEVNVEVARNLAQYQVKVPEEIIVAGLASVSKGDMTSAQLATSWAETYRQVSPEYIVAIGFLAIVLFQYLVSRWAEGRSPFGILMLGTGMIGVSFLIGGMAHTVAIGGMMVMTCMFVFSFGEMLASPKSQEYVASTTPKEQSALFMGYYFVSMALGYLFAGILSGWAYGEIALKANQPFLMWGVFAILSSVTVLILVLFNRYLAQHMAILSTSDPVQDPIL